jgi:hypothetical protein
MRSAHKGVSPFALVEIEALPYAQPNGMYEDGTIDMATVNRSFSLVAKIAHTFFGKITHAVSNPVPCWEDYLRQTR